MTAGGSSLPRIVVAGLGPGDPALVSTGAAEAIAAIPRRWLRTRRHPSAHLVEPAESFDSLYESSTDMEGVYASIVDSLVDEAARHGEVVYIVPGSPLVAEHTVEMLRFDPRIELRVVPSLSFVDLAWDRLGVDPLATGVAIVDGHRFAEQAAGLPGPLLVGQCDSRFVLSEIKLAIDDGPEVTVLQRLGLPDERVARIAWDDLDRSVEPDHLTSIWVPALSAPVAAEFVRFDALVRILRAGCPWDAAQDHRSLTRHLLEETYEVLEAIDGLDGPDGYEALEEELGDLLFQIGFHSVLAAEQGAFNLADVARGIHDKLVSRHPHVFGPPGTPQPDWEAQKRLEKNRSSALDGVPGHLPALLYAYKLQSRAASFGFDWQDAASALPKVEEELAELRDAIGGHDAEMELGDVIFSVVNVARHLRIDPETALRSAAVKFRKRYLAMERLAAERNVAIDDSLWDEVKAQGL